MMTPLMNSAAPVVKEHFTISVPALLGRPDAECIEPFQGGDGFVCRQNPLPIGDQGQSDALRGRGSS